MPGFVIQTNSDVPIYRQLVAQVHRMAASGRLAPEEKLPSVRQLAQELAVNPMTVSKAYSQLEQEGLLERRRGIGMVLRADIGNRDDLLHPVLDELVRQARQLGIEKKEILKLVSTRWKDKTDD